MKLNKHIFSAFLSLALLSACEGNRSLDLPGYYITINTGKIETRAEGDGDDALNENLIHTIDYFIYGADGTGAPKITGHLDVDVTKTTSFKIDLGTTAFSTVFGSTEAKIYAVVNLPESSALSTTATMEEVKAVVATADFASSATQASFLMSGEGTLQDDGDNTGSGTVEVKRVASKISLNFTVQEYCTDANSTNWYTHPENMKVELINCRNAATVGGTAEKAADASNFSYASRTASTNGTYKEKTQYSVAPYYSYPVSWDHGDALECRAVVTMPVTEGSADGSNRRDCYYEIILPNSSFLMNNWYNYQVDLKLLGSFNKETPTVTTPDDVTFYVVGWGGVYATQGEHTEGNFGDIRFLTVEKNEYTAYNLETLEIPISTSHECEIVDATVAYDQWTSSGVTSLTDQDLSTIGATITVTDDIITLNHAIVNDITSSSLDVTPYTYTFTVQHVGNSAYKEVMTIVQTPAIIITREENAAYKYQADTTNTGDNVGLGTRGDVYVNGQYRYIYNGTDFQEKSYNTAYNTVRYRTAYQYMYVIETLVQPQNSNYIIADPRLGPGYENQLMIPAFQANVTVGTTDGKSVGSASTCEYQPGDYAPLFSSTNDSTVLLDPGLSMGPALYGTSPRKMMYYYSTRTDSASDNYISPKFRISSRFGSAGDCDNSSLPNDKREQLNYLAVARRCATYQEAGYPAGRWRLPTKAEIDYVVAIQKLNKIPTVYESVHQYYTASVILKISNLATWTVDQATTAFTSNPSIRCVYDEWFWENLDSGKNRLPAADWATFTWGDVKRKTDDTL